jgi:hypothetical protein
VESPGDLYSVWPPGFDVIAAPLVNVFARFQDLFYSLWPIANTTSNTCLPIEDDR